jgi:DNA modification methylase
MRDVSLHLGDCLEVMRTLEANSVDLILTDPPYGKCFHDGGVGGIPSSKWHNPSIPRFAGVSIAGDNAPDTRVIREFARTLRPGGAVYIFSQWMVEAAWIEAIVLNGIQVRNRLIWAKPFHGAGDLKTTFGPQHESIIYATNGRHELRGRRDGDVWLEPIGANGCFTKGNEHPNQKPIDLCAWLIQKSSDIGATILDPFMGSGTTGVACVRTGRRFIGIEMHEPYFRIAERRIAEAQLQAPLFPVAETQPAWVMPELFEAARAD